MNTGFPSSGKILLMDDAMDEVVLLERHLVAEGFSVDYVPSVRSAIEHLKCKSYDVAILDVLMEPGIITALRTIFAKGMQQSLLQPEPHQEQGFAVARWLRQNQPEVGVIMLTGRFVEEEHALLGLEGGADDYISKSSLRLKEFSARVRTLIRRCQPFSKEKVATPLFDLYVKPQKIASASGKFEYLTDAEYMALQRLIKDTNQIVTRDQILQSANLRPTEANGLRAADTLVRNIREKFSRCGIDASVIRTLRGKGYTLEGSCRAKVIL